MDGQSYCLPCQSAYMREWRKKATERALLRAKNEGVEQFRLKVVEVFQTQVGDQGLTGWAVAKIVRDLR